MSNTPLSDIEVLQSISGGLGLKGILLENDCYSTSCETVIALPSSVTFTQSVLEKTIHQKEFYSRKKRNDFLRSLENGEYSLTVNYEKLIDKLDIHSESYWNKHYFGIVRYCFLPAASFSFDIEDITLTDRCVQALRNLEAKFQISSCVDRQTLCENFFREFGSHVNVGPIHFGGIFLWKSDYHSIDAGDNLIIKEISENAIDSFVGVSNKLKFPSLTERLSLEVSCVGGSMETNLFEKWEESLDLDRSSWSLIDRGSAENFVHSWNLLENHQHCFKDLSELQMILDNAWAKYKENKLVVEVQKYCQDNRFAKNCKIYLEIVANSRIDQQNITGWHNFILKPEIIELMVAILRYKDDLDAAHIYDIKQLLARVLEDTADITFPGIEDLQRWVNPSTVNQKIDVPHEYTIASFIQEVEHYIIPILQEIYTNDDTSRKEVQCKYDFAARVKRAISALAGCNKHYDATFLKLMLLQLDYDLDFDIFPYCERLSFDGVQNFIKCVEDEYTKFGEINKQDVETVNFHLLELALRAVNKEGDKAAKESKFKTILNHINFEAGCRGIIESYIKELITWDKLTQVVKVFNDNNYEPVENMDDDTFATCEVDSLEGQAVQDRTDTYDICLLVDKYPHLHSRIKQKSCGKKVGTGYPSSAVKQLEKDKTYVENNATITAGEKKVKFEDNALGETDNSDTAANETTSVENSNHAVQLLTHFADNSMLFSDGNVPEMSNDPSFIEATIRGKEDKTGFIESYVNQTIAWGKLTYALNADLVDESHPDEIDSRCLKDLTEVLNTNISNSDTQVGDDCCSRNLFTDTEKRHVDNGEYINKEEIYSVNCRDKLFEESRDKKCRNIPRYPKKLDGNHSVLNAKRKPTEEVKGRCLEYYNEGDASCIYATLRANLRKVKSASDLTSLDNTVNESIPTMAKAKPIGGSKSTGYSYRWSKHGKRTKHGKVSAFKRKFEGWGSTPNLSNYSSADIIITPENYNCGTPVGLRASFPDLATDVENINDVISFRKRSTDQGDGGSTDGEDGIGILTDQSVSRFRIVRNMPFPGERKDIQEASLSNEEKINKGGDAHLVHGDDTADVASNDTLNEQETLDSVNEIKNDNCSHTENIMETGIMPKNGTLSHIALAQSCISNKQNNYSNSQSNFERDCKSIFKNYPSSKMTKKTSPSHEAIMKEIANPRISEYPYQQIRSSEMGKGLSDENRVTSGSSSSPQKLSEQSIGADQPFKRRPLVRSNTFVVKRNTNSTVAGESPLDEQTSSTCRDTLQKSEEETDRIQFYSVPIACEINESNSKKPGEVIHTPCGSKIEAAIELYSRETSRHSKMEAETKTHESKKEVETKTDNSKKEVETKTDNSKKEVETKTDNSKKEVETKTNNSKKEVETEIDIRKKEVETKRDDSKKEVEIKTDDSKKEVETKTDDSKKEVETKTDDSKKEVGPKTDDSKKEIETKTNGSKKEVERKTNDSNKEIETKTDDSKKEVEAKTEGYYRTKIQVLDHLGLISYYPSKITLTDVRRFFKTTVDEMSDVPWLFLNRILMLDYNGRNKLQFPREGQNCVNESDASNDLDALFNTPSLNDKSVNPLDVVVAVVLCADPFLKQLLAQKLYMCRLSIPFLVPQLTNEHVVQLWSIRGIALGTEFENDSAVSYPSPIVSFVRFGDLPQSKSKLLNDILSDQSNDTFFHKDCGNGTEKKILSDGMIDVTWYIPSPLLKCLCNLPNACKCHLSRVVMFLNLHGDSNAFDPARKFISRISNIVAAVIDVRKLKKPQVIDCLRQTVENTKKMLLVFTNGKHLPTQHFKEDYGNLLKLLSRSKGKVRPLLTFSQDGKPINLQKLKENIKSVMNQILSETDGTAKSLIDHFKYLYMANISIDEEEPVSKSSHSDAYSVYNIMRHTELGNIKDKFLPLQGDLWKQWGALERDIKRGQPDHNVSHEHYVSSLHMQQAKTRDDQVKKYWGSNRVMQMICGNLTRLKGHNLRFYIHWVQYYLDELSRRHLPQIRRKLQNKWSELTSLQQDGTENDYKSEYRFLKCEIQDLEKCLEKASLGLEHIFREVGQLYEAFIISAKADRENKHRFQDLPHVMAQLLLMGYTVELMDGNARQVPMTFTKAVFNELDKLIQGKVFILSVLGLQSSGKSTLLNAMFGVQFSTSAGRCTQGVNAQLVAMPQYIYAQYGYEYIMLIDTEGLRAADLGDENRQRDNELATLVVGLGDLSIINVKGENQAELNDVLQIVVHALLKIKMVNKRLSLQSSCFFIHQNVGAVDAEAKLLEEQMKLSHKLDVIALAAAAQTGHHDITSLSKIIEFDVQRDIRYFCDLWQGDPPMAPTNPGYSKKVKDVKITLLEAIIPRKESKTDMKTLSSRLEDLWNGILDEDFVFSFKNSQEIKAYTTLETEFNNIKWELKEKGLIWLNDIKLDVKGSSSDDFSINQYQIQLEDKMEAAYEDVGKMLTTFCKKSNERNILEQWRGNYQLKLKDLKDETISETIKMLKDDIHIRKRQLENDKRSNAWKEAFRKKAIDLAKSESSSKKKLTSKEMKAVFQELWDESLKELPLCKFDPEDNVELIVSSVLKKAARPNHQVFQHYSDGLKAKTLDMTNFFQPMEKYIMKSDGLIKQLWRNLFHEYTEKVEEITQRIFKKVANDIANMKQENFSRAHVDKVVEIITKEIDEWNQAGKLFELTAWYKVEMLVKVGEKVKPTFLQLQNNFRTKVDPRSQLEHFKSLLLTEFIDTIEQIKKEKTVAKLVSQVVETAIKEKTNIDLPRDLANDVRTNNGFMLSKKELLTKVLTDLANEDDFLEYMKFVDNTNEFLRARLKKYTHEYLFNADKKFATLAVKRYLSNFASVSKNLESMRQVLDQTNVDPNLEEWTESFIIAMKNTVPITKDVMNDVIKDSISENFDIKVFDEFLVQRFNKVEDNLKLFYTNVNILDDLIEQHVIQQLAGSVLGCSKQCPFCRVSCALTVNDHDVDCSSPQHYPKGVAGYHWTMNKKLAIDTCTTAVASDLTFRNIDTKYKGIPFKDYKKFYTTWKIQGDKSLDASLYWKWFMAKYIDQLTEYYHHERPSIPEAWNVPKEAAIRSLAQI